jgi:hypothetical protein
MSAGAEGSPEILPPGPLDGCTNRRSLPTKLRVRADRHDNVHIPCAHARPYGFPGDVVPAGELVGGVKSNIDFVSVCQLATMITTAATMIKKTSQRNAAGTRSSAFTVDISAIPAAPTPDREGDCGGLLLIERSWTADELTVPKIKSQETVRVPRNTDPDALPDFAEFVIAASEPQRAFSAKVEPIEPTIDPQRRGEPSWSSRQVAQALDAAI